VIRVGKGSCIRNESNTKKDSSKGGLNTKKDSSEKGELNRKWFE